MSAFEYYISPRFDWKTKNKELQKNDLGRYNRVSTPFETKESYDKSVHKCSNNSSDLVVFLHIISLYCAQLYFPYSARRKNARYESLFGSRTVRTSDNQLGLAHISSVRAPNCKCVSIISVGVCAFHPPSPLPPPGITTDPSNDVFVLLHVQFFLISVIFPSLFSKDIVYSLRNQFISWK